MKKMLTLVLVLAVASLASANFAIVDGSGNSSVNVAGPGTTTLYLKYIGADLMMFDVELNADAGATLGNVVILSGAGAGYAGTSIPGITGKQVEVVDGFDNGTMFATGTTLASFDVTYTATTIVSGYDYMSVTAGFAPLNDASVSGFTVNVIPEPVTMALLGIGGLFLRRKK
ncbi:MAG: PEP-CTERM sorting domain-containing protein [Sedimentisphaerales bacterium]